MKVTKVSSKVLFALTNQNHVKKVEKGLEEFATILSAAKNEKTSFKVAALPRLERGGNLETVKEEVPRLPFVEKEKRAGKLPTRDHIEDRKIAKKPQRNREQRLRDDTGLVDPLQVSGSVKTERGVPQRSISKTESVPKSDVPKSPEPSSRMKTIGDTTLPVSDHQLGDRAVRRLREVRESSENGLVETGRGEEEKTEKAQVTVSKKIGPSTEEPVPLKPRPVETKEPSSERSLVSTTSITRYIDETGEPTAGEESAVQSQTPTVDLKEGQKAHLLEFAPERVKTSGSFVNEPNRTLAMKDGSAYALRNDREEVLKEIVQVRVFAERPSSQEEILPVFREEVPFEDQAKATSDEKRSVFEIPHRVQREIEGETVENTHAKVELGEPVVENEVPHHTSPGSRHQTGEEETTNHHKLELFPASPERVLNSAKVSENIQEVKSDARETEVVIFYEKRERLENFREVFDENLSELVQRSKAQEAYVLQGSTKSEETVPVHSVPRIVERMFVQREERAIVTLNPPELGRVEVVIEKNGDEVHVTLRVYTEEAKNALEKEVPQLVDRLSERGLDVRVQIEKQEERDLLQEEGRRERRQRERRASKVEREDFSETMREVVG